MTQTDNGKAFEYAIASALSKLLGVEIRKGKALDVADACYKYLDNKTRQWIDRAADESSVFLTCHYNRFENGTLIFLQDDKIGIKGDVRDIVIQIPKSEIGISAKHNHKAIKHSRLSDTIDFGRNWADYACSSSYFRAINPIFKDLRVMREQKMLFRDINGKDARIYLPILTAFEDELKRLCENFRELFVKRMFRYLLGKHDFYKVIKDRKIVSIQSMNMEGNLKWGKKWKIPNRIESVNRKRGSNNTLLVSFTGGWQLSFRIHNASSRVEPSLKFDIQFVGMPQDVARHEIDLQLSN